MDIRKSIVAVTALFLLSGCEQMAEDMRRARAAQDERECNPGSNCWSRLNPDQRIQMARLRQQQAYQAEQLQLQRESLEIQRQRQRREAWFAPQQTDCKSDRYGNTRCTSY